MNNKRMLSIMLSIIMAITGMCSGVSAATTGSSDSISIETMEITGTETPGTTGTDTGQTTGGDTSGTGGTETPGNAGTDTGQTTGGDTSGTGGTETPGNAGTDPEKPADAEPAVTPDDGRLFADVPLENWFAEAVEYVYYNSLMNGLSDTTFDPDGNLTRGMFVTILGRLANVDQSLYQGASFNDIEIGRWYSPYVEWAQKNNISQGMGDGSFGITQSITREQMATFIARYLESTGISLPDAENPVKSFLDQESVSVWAQEGLEVMRKSGLISGDEHGNFNPKKNASRAEAATIFMRLNSLLDPSTTKQILPASISAGEIVKAGEYEQDGDAANGKEPIEWIVLKKQDGKALLLSKYGLDVQEAGSSAQNSSIRTEEKNVESLSENTDQSTDVSTSDSDGTEEVSGDNSAFTWENSTVRSWLNNDFINEAFRFKDQRWILPTKVENPDTYCGYDDKDQDLFNNTGNGMEEILHQIDGGSDTIDKVFLLSIDEASSLLGTGSQISLMRAGSESNGSESNGTESGGSSLLQTSATAYAQKQGAWSDPKLSTSEGNAACQWWLRSAGVTIGSVSYVDSNGTISSKMVSGRTSGSVGGGAVASDNTSGSAAAGSENVSGNRIAVRPAIWMELQDAEDGTLFQVSFDANGGNAVNNTISVTKGENYGSLPSAKRTGYRFEGWFTKPAGGEEVTEKTVVKLNDDQVLYAHWTFTGISSSVNVKDVITFGSYEQDNDLSNGAEPVEWIVLKKENGRILLLSKYGLDAKPYHDTDQDVTWETSSLRTWLNTTFFNAAFGDLEQKSVMETKITNPDSYLGEDENGSRVSNNTGTNIFNIQYHINGGNSTSDQVFLLSIDEAKELLGYTKTTLKKDSGESYEGYPDLQMTATEWAKAQGACMIDYCLTAEGDACTLWWLRSPGRSSRTASCVFSAGNIDFSYTGNENFAVRPAVWVKIAS